MEDTLAKQIGTRIKDERKKRNMTQKELADKVDISPAAINQFEKGVKKPSSEVLTKIAKALDISTDYLLTERGDQIFVDEEVKTAFRGFKSLSEEDRETILKNIRFLLKEKSKSKGK